MEENGCLTNPSCDLKQAILDHWIKKEGIEELKATNKWDSIHKKAVASNKDMEVLSPKIWRSIQQRVSKTGIYRMVIQSGQGKSSMNMSITLFLS